MDTVYYINLHISGFSIYSADAKEIDCLAKYINDSPSKFANCVMKKCVTEGVPRIFFKSN